MSRAANVRLALRSRNQRAHPARGCTPLREDGGKNPG